MDIILLFALDEAVRRPRRRVGCERVDGAIYGTALDCGPGASALIHGLLITTGHVGNQDGVRSLA